MLSFEKNLASRPKENALFVSTKPKTVFALSLPTFGKLRSWQTSFLVPASAHIYRTISFHLPFFLPSPAPPFFFVLSLHTFPLLYTFSRRDKIHSRERMYSFRCLYFAVLSVPSVVEVPLVSPLLREKVFECISTFPWNVLHLQFLFLNLFSRQSFTLTYVCVQIVFFI